MNKERLLKLAEHLESGVLGHTEFRFDRLNDKWTETNPCGTQGCALGECPIAFPKEWEFRFMRNEFIPVLKTQKESTGERRPAVIESFPSAEEFFDIDEDESTLLFQPGEKEDEYDDENKGYYVGKQYILGINGDSTKEEVAAHIRNFITAKESNLPVNVI